MSSTAAPPSSEKTYTASDGKIFQDRKAYKKYEFELSYAYRNKTGETSYRKPPGSLNGQPFEISDLTDCMAEILDFCDQVQVDNCKGSKLFIGPCCESIFVRDCSDCNFTIACKQLRTRDCKNCKFNLYSMTEPIIETSTGIEFHPFNGAYPDLGKNFEKACLDPKINLYQRVYDFNDPNKMKQNYTVTRPYSGQEQWEVKIEGLSLPKNPCLFTQLNIPEPDWIAERYKAPASTELELVVGSVVDARYKGKKKWYGGRVTNINPDDTYNIAYDDGGKEDNVKKEFIRSVGYNLVPLPEVAPPYPEDMTAPVEVGCIVESRYKGKYFYPGRIAFYHEEWRTYDVLYDDGGFERKVKREFIRAPWVDGLDDDGNPVKKPDEGTVEQSPVPPSTQDVTNGAELPNPPAGSMPKPAPVLLEQPAVQISAAVPPPAKTC